MSWQPAEDCKTLHPYGEEGWRPTALSDRHEHWVPDLVEQADRGARCRECGSSDLTLAWAAMKPWDFDSWCCHRGHTFAGLPAAQPQGTYRERVLEACGCKGCTDELAAAQGQTDETLRERLVAVIYDSLSDTFGWVRDDTVDRVVDAVMAELNPQVSHPAEDGQSKENS